MKYLLFIVLVVAVVITAGCMSGNQNTPVPRTPQIVYVTVLVTPIQTPYPTPTSQSVFLTVTPDQKTQEQSTENIWIMGGVYGLASNPSAGITEIKFDIGLAPGASSIDLTKMKIVFATPSTTPIILTQGATATTSIFTTKLNGASNVNSMNPNDRIEIAFKVSPVPANTKIRIELRPSVGAALPFTKTAPATITGWDILH